MKAFYVAASMVLATQLLTGCVGYNTALFATKSNVGLDADTKPPTFELTIARRELAIAPAFAHGSPTLLGSFRLETNSSVPLFPRITSTFSGGDAALTMATLFDRPTATGAVQDASILSKEPIRPKKILGLIPVSLAKSNDTKPFIFGTDTSFGLKVAWSGTTAAYPDTVRLGLHRKEMALAPLFQTKTNNEYRITMPSFLATLDNSSELQTMQSGGVKHVQFFATGNSATSLATQQEVRKAMISRLDPKMKTAVQAYSDNFDQQTASYEAVEEAYEGATPEVKRAIRWAAFQLKLVPSDGEADWEDNFNAAVDGNSSDRTAAFKKLQELVAPRTSP